jgi:hypothetical protein
MEVACQSSPTRGGLNTAHLGQVDGLQEGAGAMAQPPSVNSVLSHVRHRGGESRTGGVQEVSTIAHPIAPQLLYLL